MNTIKIDSLRIRIKLDNVKLLDSELTDEFARLNETTGEIAKDNETDKSHRLTLKVNGCRYDFQLRNFTINKLTETFLVLTLNSKMLRRDYFNGLNEVNLPKIYTDIINLRVAAFSWKTFWNESFATDIDFFIDFTANENQYQRGLMFLKKITPYTKERDKGFKKYKNGLEWNRRGAANNSNPYAKFYDKTTELSSRGEEFLHDFLLGDDRPNQKRFEFTIKGASHLKYLGVGNSSLSSVVGLSQETRYNLLKGVVKRIFDLDLVDLYLTEIDTKLRPEKMVLANALKILSDSGLEKTILIEQLTNNLKSTPKSRYMKQLNEMWETHVANGIRYKDPFGNSPFLRFILVQN